MERYAFFCILFKSNRIEKIKIETNVTDFDNNDINGVHQSAKITTLVADVDMGLYVQARLNGNLRTSVQYCYEL